jgi:hypothetical protein
MIKVGFSQWFFSASLRWIPGGGNATAFGSPDSGILFVRVEKMHETIHVRSGYVGGDRVLRNQHTYDK